MSNCPESDVCFQVGVPEVVASSGSGNIYFQLSASTSYSWVGVGTGSRMAGATMFIIYTDGNGNVTVSPRGASGHSMPTYDSSISVELLAGSGVEGNSMTANFLVSNLDIDVSSDSSSWIAAWRDGSSLDSSSVSETILQHADYTNWAFDLTQATIADDSNPYTGNAGENTDTDNGNSGNGSGSDSDSTGSGNSGVVGGSSSSGADTKTIMYIHAIVASVAFVILMPFASVLMPLLGKWYIHAGLQLLSFVAMWVGFGLGVKVANDYGIVSSGSLILHIIEFHVGY